MIADLHIHSRYSRATSKNITIENLEKYAKIKGIDMLGTGDFTHPKWFEEINQLEEKEGILYTKTGFPFLLSTEISFIFTQEKQRRVHLLILAPSLEIVKQINAALLKRGRLDYDGRPIFGMSCIKFFELMHEISDEIEIIPAHAWTPWYGIFGSMSGFDSLKEAFQEYAKKIHAIETGMSSDPALNWRLSELNEKTITSFSDAHSFWPWRLGREATIFNIDKEKLNYKKILEQIRNNSIEATVETSPSYGKYHFDGHRNCDFSCSPEESKKFQGICPVCKKPLIIGVLNRVEALADKPEEFRPKNAKPFYTLLPLHELIAAVYSFPVASKKTWQVYNALIEKFGSELNVLLNAKQEEIARIDKKIIPALMLNREGKIKVKPGYDGVYGTAILEEQKKLEI